MDSNQVVRNRNSAVGTLGGGGTSPSSSSPVVLLSPSEEAQEKQQLLLSSSSASAATMSTRARTASPAAATTGGSATLSGHHHTSSPAHVTAIMMNNNDNTNINHHLDSINYPDDADDKKKKGNPIPFAKRAKAAAINVTIRWPLRCCSAVGNGLRDFFIEALIEAPPLIRAVNTALIIAIVVMIYLIAEQTIRVTRGELAAAKAKHNRARQQAVADAAARMAANGGGGGGGSSSSNHQLQSNNNNKKPSMSLEDFHNDGTIRHSHDEKNAKNRYRPPNHQEVEPEEGAGVGTDAPIAFNSAKDRQRQAMRMGRGDEGKRQEHADDGDNNEEEARPIPNAEDDHDDDDDDIERRSDQMKRSKKSARAAAASQNQQQVDSPWWKRVYRAVVKKINRNGDNGDVDAPDDRQLRYKSKYRKNNKNDKNNNENLDDEDGTSADDGYDDDSRSLNDNGQKIAFNGASDYRRYNDAYARRAKAEMRRSGKNGNNKKGGNNPALFDGRFDSDYNENENDFDSELYHNRQRALDQLDDQKKALLKAQNEQLYEDEGFLNGQRGGGGGNSDNDDDDGNSVDEKGGKKSSARRGPPPVMSALLLESEAKRLEEHLAMRQKEVDKLEAALADGDSDGRRYRAALIQLRREKLLKMDDAEFENNSDDDNENKNQNNHRRGYGGDNDENSNGGAAAADDYELELQQMEKELQRKRKIDVMFSKKASRDEDVQINSILAKEDDLVAEVVNSEKDAISKEEAQIKALKTQLLKLEKKTRQLKNRDKLRRGAQDWEEEQLRQIEQDREMQRLKWEVQRRKFYRWLMKEEASSSNQQQHLALPSSSASSSASGNNKFVQQVAALLGVDASTIALGDGHKSSSHDDASADGESSASSSSISDSAAATCPGMRPTFPFMPYDTFLRTTVAQPEYAYVTFITAPSYVRLAATLMYSIAVSGSLYSRCVLVTKEISSYDRAQLALFAHVIEIDGISSPLDINNPQYKETFTKLRIWELEPLYAKVLYVDADVLVTKNMDDLFDIGIGGMDGAAPGAEWATPMDADQSRYSTGMMLLRPSLEMFDRMMISLKEDTTMQMMELPDLLFLKLFFETVWPEELAKKGLKAATIDKEDQAKLDAYELELVKQYGATSPPYSYNNYYGGGRSGGSSSSNSYKYGDSSSSNQQAYNNANANTSLQAPPVQIVKVPSPHISLISRWYQVYQGEFGRHYASYLTHRRQKVTIFDSRVHGIHYPGHSKPWQASSDEGASGINVDSFIDEQVLQIRSHNKKRTDTAASSSSEYGMGADAEDDDVDTGSSSADPFGRISSSATSDASPLLSYFEDKMRKYSIAFCAWKDYVRYFHIPLSSRRYGEVDNDYWKANANRYSSNGDTAATIRQRQQLLEQKEKAKNREMENQMIPNFNGRVAEAKQQKNLGGNQNQKKKSAVISAADSYEVLPMGASARYYDDTPLLSFPKGHQKTVYLHRQHEHKRLQLKKKAYGGGADDGASGGGANDKVAALAAAIMEKLDDAQSGNQRDSSSASSSSNSDVAVRNMRGIYQDPSDEPYLFSKEEARDRVRPFDFDAAFWWFLYHKQMLNAVKKITIHRRAINREMLLGGSSAEAGGGPSSSSSSSSSSNEDFDDLVEMELEKLKQQQQHLVSAMASSSYAAGADGDHDDKREQQQILLAKLKRKAVRIAKIKARRQQARLDDPSTDLRALQYHTNLVSAASSSDASSSSSNANKKNSDLFQSHFNTRNGDKSYLNEDSDENNNADDDVDAITSDDDDDAIAENRKQKRSRESGGGDSFSSKKSSYSSYYSSGSSSVGDDKGINWKLVMNDSPQDYNLLYNNADYTRRLQLNLGAAWGYNKKFFQRRLKAIQQREKELLALKTSAAADGSGSGGISSSSRNNADGTIVSTFKHSSSSAAASTTTTDSLTDTLSTPLADPLPFTPLPLHGAKLSTIAAEWRAILNYRKAKEQLARDKEIKALMKELRGSYEYAANKRSNSNNNGGGNSYYNSDNNGYGNSNGYNNQQGNSYYNNNYNNNNGGGSAATSRPPAGAALMAGGNGGGNSNNYFYGGASSEAPHSVASSAANNGNLQQQQQKSERSFDSLVSSSSHLAAASSDFTFTIAFDQLSFIKKAIALSSSASRVKEELLDLMPLLLLKKTQQKSFGHQSSGGDDNQNHNQYQYHNLDVNNTKAFLSHLSEVVKIAYSSSSSSAAEKSFVVQLLSTLANFESAALRDGGDDASSSLMDSLWISAVGSSRNIKEKLSLTPSSDPAADAMMIVDRLRMLSSLPSSFSSSSSSVASSSVLCAFSPFVQSAIANLSAALGITVDDNDHHNEKKKKNQNEGRRFRPSSSSTTPSPPPSLKYSEVQRLRRVIMNAQKEQKRCNAMLLTVVEREVGEWMQQMTVTAPPATTSSSFAASMLTTLPVFMPLATGTTAEEMMVMLANGSSSSISSPSSSVVFPSTPVDATVDFWLKSRVASEKKEASSAYFIVDENISKINDSSSSSSDISAQHQQLPIRLVSESSNGVCGTGLFGLSPTTLTFGPTITATATPSTSSSSSAAAAAPSSPSRTKASEDTVDAIVDMLRMNVSRVLLEEEMALLKQQALEEALFDAEMGRIKALKKKENEKKKATTVGDDDADVDDTSAQLRGGMKNLVTSAGTAAATDIAIAPPPSLPSFAQNSTLVSYRIALGLVAQYLEDQITHKLTMRGGVAAVSSASSSSSSSSSSGMAVGSSGVATKNEVNASQATLLAKLLLSPPSSPSPSSSATAVNRSASTATPPSSDSASHHSQHQSPATIQFIAALIENRIQPLLSTAEGMLTDILLRQNGVVPTGSGVDVAANEKKEGSNSERRSPFEESLAALDDSTYVTSSLLSSSSSVSSSIPFDSPTLSTDYIVDFSAMEPLVLRLPTRSDAFFFDSTLNSANNNDGGGGGSDGEYNNGEEGDDDIIRRINAQAKKVAKLQQRIIDGRSSTRNKKNKVADTNDDSDNDYIADIDSDQQRNQRRRLQQADDGEGQGDDGNDNMNMNVDGKYGEDGGGGDYYYQEGNDDKNVNNNNGYGEHPRENGGNDADGMPPPAGLFGDDAENDQQQQRYRGGGGGSVSNKPSSASKAINTVFRRAPNPTLLEKITSLRRSSSSSSSSISSPSLVSSTTDDESLSTWVIRWCTRGFFGANLHPSPSSSSPTNNLDNDNKKKKNGVSAVVAEKSVLYVSFNASFDNERKKITTSDNDIDDDSSAGAGGGDDNGRHRRVLLSYANNGDADEDAGSNSNRRQRRGEVDEEERHRYNNNKNGRRYGGGGGRIIDDDDQQQQYNKKKNYDDADGGDNEYADGGATGIGGKNKKADDAADDDDEGSAVEPLSSQVDAFLKLHRRTLKKNNRHARRKRNQQKRNNKNAIMGAACDSSLLLSLSPAATAAFASQYYTTRIGSVECNRVRSSDDDAASSSTTDSGDSTSSSSSSSESSMATTMARSYGHTLQVLPLWITRDAAMRDFSSSPSSSSTFTDKKKNSNNKKSNVSSSSYTSFYQFLQKRYVTPLLTIVGTKNSSSSSSPLERLQGVKMMNMMNSDGTSPSSSSPTSADNAYSEMTSNSTSSSTVVALGGVIFRTTAFEEVPPTPKQMKKNSNRNRDTNSRVDDDDSDDGDHDDDYDSSSSSTPSFFKRVLEVVVRCDPSSSSSSSDSVSLDDVFYNATFYQMTPLEKNKRMKDQNDYISVAGAVVVVEDNNDDISPNVDDLKFFVHEKTSSPTGTNRRRRQQEKKKAGAATTVSASIHRIYLKSHRACLVPSSSSSSSPSKITSASSSAPLRQRRQRLQSLYALKGLARITEDFVDPIVAAAAGDSVPSSSEKKALLNKKTQKKKKKTANIFAPFTTDISSSSSSGKKQRQQLSALLRPSFVAWKRAFLAKIALVSGADIRTAVTNASSSSSSSSSNFSSVDSTEENLPSSSSSSASSYSLFMLNLTAIQNHHLAVYRFTNPSSPSSSSTTVDRVNNEAASSGASDEQRDGVRMEGSAASSSSSSSMLANIYRCGSTYSSHNSKLPSSSSEIISDIASAFASSEISKQKKESIESSSDSDKKKVKYQNSEHKKAQQKHPQWIQIADQSHGKVFDIQNAQTLTTTATNGRKGKKLSQNSVLIQRDAPFSDSHLKKFIRDEQQQRGDHQSSYYNYDRKQSVWTSLSPSSSSSTPSPSSQQQQARAGDISASSSVLLHNITLHDCLSSASATNEGGSDDQAIIVVQYASYGQVSSANELLVESTVDPDGGVVPVSLTHSGIEASNHKSQSSPSESSSTATSTLLVSKLSPPSSSSPGNVECSPTHKKMMKSRGRSDLHSIFVGSYAASSSSPSADQSNSALLMTTTTASPTLLRNMSSFSSHCLFMRKKALTSATASASPSSPTSLNNAGNLLLQSLTAADILLMDPVRHMTPMLRDIDQWHQQQNNKNNNGDQKETLTFNGNKKFTEVNVAKDDGNGAEEKKSGGDDHNSEDLVDKLLRRLNEGENRHDDYGDSGSDGNKNYDSGRPPLGFSVFVLNPLF